MFFLHEMNCVCKHPYFSSSRKQLIYVHNFFLLDNFNMEWKLCVKNAKKGNEPQQLVEESKMFKQFTCKSWFIHSHTRMIYFYLFVFHEKNIMAQTRKEAKTWEIGILMWVVYILRMNINSIMNVREKNHFKVIKYFKRARRGCEIHKQRRKLI